MAVNQQSETMPLSAAREMPSLSLSISFSSALVGSGLRWDDETMDFEWGIPRKQVPQLRNDFVMAKVGVFRLL